MIKTKGRFASILFVAICLAVMIAVLLASGIVASAASSESESNDTAATATGISINQTVSGNISANGDNDWYKFTVTEQGWFNVSFTHDIVSSSGSHWRLYLYRADASSGIDGITSGYEIAGNADLTTSNYGVAPGTYYLRVTQSSYRTTNYYRIKVNFTASGDWETENNNSSATADEIAVNETVNGSLTMSGDEDWYKFTVTERGWFNVSFNHNTVSSTGKYWRLYLYQADAVTGIDGVSYSFDARGNENITTSNYGVAPGTYYIKIYRSDYHSANDYRLKVNFTEATTWETEYNNSSSTADTIGLNKDINGSLTMSGDEDWYRFTVTKQGWFNVSFKHDTVSSTGKHWKIYLYQGDAVSGIDSTTAAYEVAGNADLTTSNYGVAPGTYYIRIYRSDYHSANNYSVKVNFAEATNWETEYNNSSDTADSLALNKAINASLTTSNDADWYKFTVTKQGWFNVSFDHVALSSTGTHWRMYLYQSDAVSGIDGVNAGIDVRGNENIVTCSYGVAPGTYYLKIYRADYHAAADYSVTVHFTEVTDWETENNSSTANADEITLHQVINGSLTTNNDVDWYKFTLTEQAKVAASFTNVVNESSGAHWNIRIYDSTTTKMLVEYERYGNISTGVSAYADLAPGTYYVKIAKDSYYSANDYALTLVDAHDHTGEWEEDVPAGCISGGSEKRVCTICGEIETRGIDELGHDYDDGVVSVEPGMFTVGETDFTCQRCGDSYTEEDSSLLWIFPVICVGVLLFAFGVFNYIRMIKKKN